MADTAIVSARTKSMTIGEGGTALALTALAFVSLVVAAKRDALIPVTTEKDLARLHVRGELPPWAQGITAFPVKLEFDSALELRRFVSDRLIRARDAKFGKR